MKRLFGLLLVPVVAITLSLSAPIASAQEKKDDEKKSDKKKKGSKKKKGEDKKEEKK